MKYVFGCGAPKPAPRFQNHYMYMMTARIQVPITTLADGTAIAVVQPYSAFLAGYSANSNYVPFCICAAGSSSNPYAAAPNYGAAGPFNSQQASGVTYQIDTCTLDFQ